LDFAKKTHYAMTPQDETKPVINARGLYMQYPSGEGVIDVLRHVDITMAPGEFAAIMGASGSGKSTLMHILGCLERPCAGSYHLAGNHVGVLDDAALSRLRATRIGFVFQACNLIPQCTILENTELPFMYQPDPVSPRQVKARAIEALEKVGLGHRLSHKPGRLSGGELQRAAIARALVIDPLLVLADEPTGNLDVAATNNILDLFGTLNSLGVTLLVVTHDAKVAERADRVLYLENGRLQ
jgi:putative ABC transport system ATP-binding protein